MDALGKELGMDWMMEEGLGSHSSVPEVHTRPTLYHVYRVLTIASRWSTATISMRM